MEVSPLLRSMYEIFVYSGFRTFPHEIMELTENERDLVIYFLNQAKKETFVPVMLWNLIKKHRK